MKKNSFSRYSRLFAEFNNDNHLSISKRDEFNLLIAHNLNSLYTTALRMTCNQTDAENLILDTLFKAFREYIHTQKITDFKIRTYSILINEYIRAYRKITQDPQIECFDNIEEFYLHNKINAYLGPDETENGDFLEKIHEDDVVNALENLPDYFRLLILLCDVEGFSYKDITIIINAPVGDVISQLYQGRKLMQLYLWNNLNKKDRVHEVQE
jgi:RNA polymerase sigma-70 factor, ECF subfamily